MVKAWDNYFTGTPSYNKTNWREFMYQVALFTYFSLFSKIFVYQAAERFICEHQEQICWLKKQHFYHTIAQLMAHVFSPHLSKAPFYSNYFNIDDKEKYRFNAMKDTLHLRYNQENKMNARS